MDIRQFAVPCPLTGSIEVNSGYQAPPLTGSEIHLMIQRKLERENSNFISEKSFSLNIAEKKFDLIINGRADGFIEGDPAEIIEIKTSFDIQELHKKLLKDKNHPYVWQLRTYGFIYYKTEGVIPGLILKLVSSRNIKKFIDMEINLDVDHYEEWLARRLEVLSHEVKIKEKILKKRFLSSETLQFPFSKPRLGQNELVETVINSFSDSSKEGSQIIIQAPTGLGKTAGILYPAIKDSFSKGQKVVYVTPKNSQHKVAEDAIDHMNDQGASIRRLTLTSKSKMCLKDEPMCNPEYCEFAKNYYDKIESNDLITKIGKMKNLTSKKFIKLGEEFGVCPFELSLEAIPNADVVIGDYNYVFSPRSLIGRLSEPLLINNSPNLVIDEAHNLPSRAQEYFSPEISINTLEEIEFELNRLSKKYSNACIVFTSELKDLIRYYGNESSSNSKKITIDAIPFHDLEKRVRDFTISYLEDDQAILVQDPILKLSNLLNDFCAALELEGPEFFQTYQKTNHNEVLKITCSDASKQLALAYKEFANTAAFSATLKPFKYYQELLGFSAKKSQSFEFASPFKSSNRKIIMIPQISTKYKDRQGSIQKICEVIEKITSLKSGNYMALFPSFEFMNLLARELKLPHYQILIQEKKMNAKKTENFLEILKSSDAPTLLLGVQGGIFSEGVDYPGNMLIGVFVVGPALPNFDFEREQIRNYYGTRFGDQHAFNYAYVYPAMAKAIQSAGRVIRTESDRGLIVLIDPRFLESSYYETMPKEWFNENPNELLSQKILADVTDFWSAGVKS